ncbi:MAG: flagellar biosynthetic protein FliR [Proteobacteria bacterium]|nr:flagellar biosynthetic protein FliR [Pseudomonadota bacterium]
MISLTAGQIEAWMAAYLWPLLRIGACLMVAPIFGARFVPGRYRIILAGAITLLVAPLLPPVPDVSPFSGPGLVITAQQIIIGVAIGFVLQIVFDALAMGGQLLANTMGLSFAFNVDPLRGASAPVVGQFYTLIATLTFLALNGHIAIIEVLVDGFRDLPIGTSGLGTDGYWQIVQWGSQLFRGALMVSLPGLTALLIVNLAFGVVSRAAPSLNLFAIGFPVTLVGGLLIVLAGLPSMQDGFVQLMRESLTFAGNLMGGS